MLSGARSALLPDPEPARDLLARELAKPEYQPTLVERFERWLGDLLDRVFGSTVSGSGPGPVVATVLLVLLVGLVVLVLTRLQRSSAAPSGPAEVFPDGRLTAERYRELARLAREEGRWDDAVVESVRALAAGLLERGAAPRPARGHRPRDRHRLGPALPRPARTPLARRRRLRRDEVRRPRGRRGAGRSRSARSRRPSAPPVPATPSVTGPVPAVPR